MSRQSTKRTFFKLKPYESSFAIELSSGEQRRKLLENEDFSLKISDQSNREQLSALEDLLRGLTSGPLTAEMIGKAKRKILNILAFGEMMNESTPMLQILYETYLVLSCILLLEQRSEEALETLDQANGLSDAHPSLRGCTIEALIDKLITRGAFEISSPS